MIYYIYFLHFKFKQMIPQNKSNSMLILLIILNTTLLTFFIKYSTVKEKRSKIFILNKHFILNHVSKRKRIWEFHVGRSIIPRLFFVGGENLTYLKNTLHRMMNWVQLFVCFFFLISRTSQTKRNKKKTKHSYNKKCFNIVQVIIFL